MNDINNKIILSAISNSLFGKPFDINIKELSLTAEDWRNIQSECITQTVAISVLDGLNEVKDYIDPQVYMAWLEYSFTTLNRNVQVNTSQKHLINILTSNNIPYVILKGTSSACNYPKPELRHLGDIDFLIKPVDIDKTKQLLSENSYEQSMEDPHHTRLEKRGIAVEMHNEINGIPNGKVGEKTREYIRDMIDASETAIADGNPFNMPPAHMQGMVLLLHMIHHISGVGLGLRHLCDWAIFVHTQLTNELWESHYKQILTDTGLLNVTYAFTWTCVKYMSLPEKKWMIPVDDDICEGILSDILKSGNFGQKDELRGRKGILVFRVSEQNDNESIIGGINRSIIMLANDHWPIVKKLPFLIIFAYIFFPIRYLILMLAGKRPKFTGKKSLNDIRNLGKTYSKLKIFKAD